MRVVVTGATGIVGTRLLELLAHEPRVSEIVGLSRRPICHRKGKCRFETADISTDNLVRLFDRADAVVHLAWLNRATRGLDRLSRVNVLGSERVFRAAVEAGVRVIVHASSLGVYSPGPKDRRVTESWPTGAVMTSLHARQKALVEAKLSEIERENPGLRVVRLRPGLVVDGAMVARLRHAFTGGFFVSLLFRQRRARFVPDVPGLALQVIHVSDLAEAFRAALVSRASGAFNIAAEPVLDAETLAWSFKVRTAPMDARALRSKLAWGYGLRLQPVSPDWLDLALALPLVDTGRARRGLAWAPRLSSVEALLEALGARRGERPRRFVTAPLHECPHRA